MHSAHEKLLFLEKESQSLETSPEEFQSWMTTLSHFATDYLKELPQEPAHRYEGKLPDFPLPLVPSSLETELRFLKENVLSQGLNAASGKYLAYIPGGGIPTAAIGDFLAALTNRYSGTFSACPGAAEIENQCIDWLKEALHLPASTGGTLTSGGSTAGLTAIVVARDSRPPEEWKQGVLYSSSQVHHSLEKGIHIAGLGSLTHRKISTDSNYRMIPDELEKQIQKDKKSGLRPWIVFSTAGTTNTGAIDPLSTIQEITENEKLWHHVDGAYGGLFAVVPELANRFQGMGEADSLVLDPHKGFFLPYGTGAALVKKGGLLPKSFSFRPDYLADLKEYGLRSPSDCSIELTRHFRGLRLWLTWKMHGLRRIQAALHEKALLAEMAYEELRKIPEMEMGPAPQVSVVTFRLPTEERTQNLFENLLKAQTFFLSSTKLSGKTYLRLCFLSFRTHHTQLNEAISTIQESIS